MEELEVGELEYESAEEFLTSLKKEFSGGEKEVVKAAELRKLEQEGKTIEKFKRGINRMIWRKLMEAKNQLGSIEQ